MFSNLAPYPATRPVDLPWLESVPETWRLARAKEVLRPINVRSEAGDEELLTVSSHRGVVSRSSETVTMFQASSYAGHKLCWPGDLVINSLWAWGRGLGVSSKHGIVSTAYGVYRPRSQAGLDTRYLHELVRSDPFNWELTYRSRGVWKSRLQLTDDRFLAAPMPIPPAEEQAAIVKYLGHAHARIDKAIAAKRKLIALLEEQKQAIIHQAVTCGLDPNVPLKDSGIPWLGEIPVHWTLAPLGAISLFVQTGPFGSQLHAEDYVEAGVPVINPSHIRAGLITPDRSVSVSQDAARRLARHALAVGDLVLARRGELGRAAVARSVDRGSLCGTGSLIIRLREETCRPHYIQRLLGGSALSGFLSAMSVGSTMANVSAGVVSRVRVPLPPLTEQDAILGRIGEIAKVSERAQSRAAAEIELLREFRTRLTSDVVTGQVDVREIAATLAELSDEMLATDRDIAEDSMEDIAEEFLEGESD